MENYDEFEWSGYKWIPSERWGAFHYDKRWCWYDPSAVKIENDNLVLDIRYNPKSHTFDDDVTVVYPYGIGLVTCQTDFSFGYFEISCKLPIGEGLWPAFWMYDSEIWPPEIDIFEAYSKKRNYKQCFLKPWRIETCVHTNKNLNLKEIPNRSPWRWEFDTDPTKTFNTYGLWWLPDSLTFLINGKVIREIDDINLLKHISQSKMRVLINTYIDGNFANDFELINYEEPFIIEYFKHIPLQLK